MATQKAPLDDAWEALLARLTSRAFRAVMNARLFTPQSFLRASPEQFRQQHQIGKRTMEELAAARRKLLSVVGGEKAPPALTRVIESTRAAMKLKSANDSREILVEGQRHQGSVVADRLRQPSLYATDAASKSFGVGKRSVLQLTLPGLWGLSPNAIDVLWSRFDTVNGNDLRVADKVWEGLARVHLFGDDPLSSFLAVTMEVLAASNLDSVSFLQLYEALVEQARNATSEDISLRRDAFSSQPIAAGEERSALWSIPLRWLPLPQKLVTWAAEGGINTWQDCQSLSEQMLYQEMGFTLSMLRTAYALRELQPQLRLAAPGADEAYVSDDAFVDALLKETCRNERQIAMLKGLYGADKTARKLTLQEAGEMASLSRERARQVRDRFRKNLGLPLSKTKLAAFTLVVRNILRECGGACFLDELSSRVSVVFGWRGRLPAPFLEVLLSIDDSLFIDDDLEVSYREVPCLLCETAKAKLQENVARREDGIRLCEASRTLAHHCCTSCALQVSRPPNFSEGFFHLAVKGLGGIVVDNGVLLSPNAWALLRGNKVQLVEAILRAEGKPMTVAKVMAECLRWRPADEGFSQRNVQATLQRAPSVLLWHRGYMSTRSEYLHRDCAPIAGDLLREIERWLLQRLQGDAPFVAIGKAFESFKKRCTSIGIPSGVALYSCLRLTAPEHLVLPKYPQVYLKQSYEQAIPTAVAVENLVRGAGGPIPCEVVKAFVQKDLGLKSFHFQATMQQLTKVLRTKGDCFVHYDCLRLDQREVANILSYAKQLARHEHRISVQKVYEGREIACELAGVDGPDVLYAVLSEQGDGDLSFPKYPHIVYSRSGLEKVTLTAQVLAHLRNMCRPCNYDELEEQFVSRKGYSPSSIYAVANHKDVYRYGRGALVHIDVIGWDQERQLCVEEAAAQVYRLARAANKGYGLVTDIMEFHELPTLKNDVVWTKSLLADVLCRGSRFRTLGSYGNAFVALPNDLGVASFQDLVARIVGVVFKGAVELDELEEHLKAEGVIESKLSMTLFAGSDKLRVLGGTVMLEEILR